MSYPTIKLHQCTSVTVGSVVEHRGSESDKITLWTREITIYNEDESIAFGVTLYNRDGPPNFNLK